MKIRYTKKKLKLNLILGLFWLFLGLFQIIFNDFSQWSDYFWILMALIYVGTYAYEYIYQYLTIENGVLKVNNLLGKQIKLAEITRIRKFAGDYILKTNKTELTINTQIIDPSSLSELNAELEKLKIEWK